MRACVRACVCVCVCVCVGGCVLRSGGRGGVSKCTYENMNEEDKSNHKGRVGRRGGSGGWGGYGWGWGGSEENNPITVSSIFFSSVEVNEA